VTRIDVDEQRVGSLARRIACTFWYRQSSQSVTPRRNQVCRRYKFAAEECRRLADKFGSVEDKATLLDLAQPWDQLADQAGEDGPKVD
jgi:hypothetical protein